MIHVYAICDPGPPPDSPLRVVEHAGLAGVYGLVPDGDIEPSVSRLHAHETVLEELMADRALLPLRFGSGLGDESELRDLLGARARYLAAALDRVRGRVEFEVRARLGSACAADGQARLREARRAGDLIDGEVYASGVAAGRSRDPREVSRAYLVEDWEVHAFRARVAQLNASQPSFEITCTGPWPPFSFTSAEGVA